MDLSAVVDPFQQVLVQLIGALRGGDEEEIQLKLFRVTTARLFVLPAGHVGYTLEHLRC